MKSFAEEIEIRLKSIEKESLIAIDNNMALIEEKLLNKIKCQITINNFKNNFSIEYYKSLGLNHLNFIKKSFYLKNSQLLLEYLYWEISTYSKMGVDETFFKKLLTYSLESIIEIKVKELESIINIYSYMLDNFNLILEKARKFEPKDYDLPNNQVFNEFLDALLKPSLSDAIKISNNYINSTKDLRFFWENILLSSLYSIGRKWSNGEISVGQEHTATSICQRVISMHYEKILDENYELPTKKVIVAVSPKELHEIGARMVSDLLEFEGYETVFFGSNSKPEEIVQSSKDELINHILVSTTLISNIDATKQLVQFLKENLENVKVYIGGQAYNKLKQEFIDDIKADKYIKDFNELIKVLEDDELC